MALKKDVRVTTGAAVLPSLAVTRGAEAGAQTVTRVAQMAMPLLDRLNQFSGKMVEQGTQQMVINAKQKAVVDVQEGTFEEFGLRDNGASVYSMAYNGAAETAYISQTNTDVQAQAKRIAAENQYSPEGFRRAWDNHSREVSKSAKKVSPYVDAVTADVAKQYGDAAYAGIANNLSTMQFELQKKENTEALSFYENEFVAAKISGNSDAAETALMNRNKTLESMQTTFQISDRGIEAANVIFVKRVVASQVKSRFASAMQDGTSSDYLMNFRDMAAKDENFASFTPTEIQAMVDDMHKTIKGQNAYQDNILKQEERKKQVLNDEVVNTFDQAWLTGELTQGDVDLALDREAIDQTQHKFYSLKIHDTGARFTSTATELMIVENLASLSNSEIIALPDVTNEDKMKYIKQLEQYKGSEGGKWTSSVQGRAALLLLKNKYNIIGADMMAKYTKEDDVADYGKLYQSFILEMEKLPAEQRESRAMHFAQAAIDVQDAAKIEAGTSDSQNRVETQQLNLQKRINSYQRKIGKAKSQAYVQGLSEFQDDFGMTGDIDFSLRREWR